MQPDHTVVVAFDADRDVPMSTGTKLAVRYLNLVGDRFLELVDGPGSTRILPAGSQIPVDRTDSGARSRPAARRPETGHPGPESDGRQRPVGGAAADLPGPGRHAGLAAVGDLVVRQRSGGQQRRDRAVDRQPQPGGDHARRQRCSVLRDDRSPATPRHRTGRGPRSDRRGDRLAGRGHRLAGRSARPGPRSAGRHRRAN